MIANRRNFVLTLVIALVGTCTRFAALQGQEFGAFQSAETVKSLSIDIGVAPDGENLDEPIAIDFGLGFPFWLHPLGRANGSAIPFGAVANTGTQTGAIRAGEHGTFTFELENQVGQDEFHSIGQLLSNVQISDISRIGFTSKGLHGWKIASYKLSINGKPFISNDRLLANARQLQDAARAKLAELNRDLTPQQIELRELQDLAMTGLSTPADREQLLALSARVAPQLEEIARIEKQLQGASPFYMESTFRNPWRRGQSIEKMKITLVTAPHSGADSRNYVCFHVGGHKYLLGSPLNPMTAEYGVQEFDLDLTATPLTVADMRGFGLSMLAQSNSVSDCPDRWHPQRLRIEIDDRVVYDSEDNTIDRMSLSAIRIIPPAQRNSSGVVSENHPIERETFLWIAGSGAGLDLVHGGTVNLPAVDDPTFPMAESIESDSTGEFALDDSEEEDWYDPNAAPFPGEVTYIAIQEPRFGHRLRRWLWNAGGGGMWGGGFGSGWPPGSWGPGYDPGWGPGWSPGWGQNGPGLLELLLLGLLGNQGGLPSWVLPHPIGQPPQLEDVEINYAFGDIQWKVTGDESKIDHFVVDAILIRPDLDNPLQIAASQPKQVTANIRSVSVSSLVFISPVQTNDEKSRSYYLFRVRMIPTESVLGVQQGQSQATPIRASASSQGIHPSTQFIYVPQGGVPILEPLSLGGEPELSGTAVWATTEVASHTGIVFAGLSPYQHHIVARATNEGDSITVPFGSDVFPEGSYRLIAFVGFDGAVEESAEVNASVNMKVTSVANPALHLNYIAPSANVAASPSLPTTHLVPLIVDFNTIDVGPGAMTLEMRFHFNHVHIDPKHPPMLIGLRVFSM